MEEARRAGRRRLAALALPRVQPDVMVVSARREKYRLGAILLRHLEAKNSAIEGQGAVKIGHFQVDVSYAYAGIDPSIVHVERHRSGESMAADEC